MQVDEIERFDWLEAGMKFLFHLLMALLDQGHVKPVGVVRHEVLIEAVDLELCFVNIQQHEDFYLVRVAERKRYDRVENVLAHLADDFVEEDGLDQVKFEQDHSVVDFVEEERLEGLVKERHLWEVIQQVPLVLLDVGVMLGGLQPEEDAGEQVLDEM